LIRLQIAIDVRTPVTSNLFCAWYETSNIHCCTIQDFITLSKEIDAHIERGVALDRSRQPIAFGEPWIWSLFGEQGLFLLARRQ
jgi:Methionine biosynthesis protein MetW